MLVPVRPGVGARPNLLKVAPPSDVAIQQVGTKPSLTEQQQE